MPGAYRLDWLDLSWGDARLKVPEKGRRYFTGRTMKIRIYCFLREENVHERKNNMVNSYSAGFDFPNPESGWAGLGICG